MRSFIPGPSFTADAVEGTTAFDPATDMAEMIAAHCEVCGVPLPDEQADDMYPACWRCIEELLESEVRP